SRFRDVPLTDADSGLSIWVVMGTAPPDEKGPQPDFHATLTTRCRPCNDNCQMSGKRDQRPSSPWLGSSLAAGPGKPIPAAPTLEHGNPLRASGARSARPPCTSQAGP